MCGTSKRYNGLKDDKSKNLPNTPNTHTHTHCIELYTYMYIYTIKSYTLYIKLHTYIVDNNQGLPEGRLPFQ